MKPIKLFLILIVLLGSSYLNAQKISGTITYWDGNTLEFDNFKNMGMISSSNPKGLIAIYENTSRVIPYNKLKSFVVESYDGWNSGTAAMPKDVTVQITTVTGITFETQYHFLDAVWVYIFDELTGENIQQDVGFGKLISGTKVMNIKKIELNN